MSRQVRLLRLAREFYGGFASEEALDAAIQEALDKLEPEDAEGFLREFARAEGLTL